VSASTGSAPDDDMLGDGGGAVIVWDTGTYRNRTKRDGAELQDR
jgi:hypothetical protein